MNIYNFNLVIHAYLKSQMIKIMCFLNVFYTLKFQEIRVFTIFIYIFGIHGFVLIKDTHQVSW